MTATIPAFRALPAEMQQAAGAAAALALTMFLPWYQKSFFRGTERGRSRPTCSAFGVFSFVEAAVLLVAAGVLYLVWARSQRKAFHLPGGDGTVIMAAGAWALLLLVWRLFDKPDVDDRAPTVGIQWGIFVALARRRRADRGRRARARRPPARAAEPGGRRRRLGAPGARAERRAPTRRPREATAVTEVLREPPGLGGRAARGARPRPRASGRGRRATARSDRR